MRPLYPCLLWLVSGFALLSGAGSQSAKAAEPFSFIALGCLPYGEPYFEAFERLLAEINRRALRPKL